MAQELTAATGKKEPKKNRKGMTVAEILFSLLTIPTGLAYARSIERGAEEVESQIFLMFAFLFLAIALCLRAAGNRYKTQRSARRGKDFAFSAVFLLCAVLILLLNRPEFAIKLACSAFLVSIMGGRVLSIIRTRRWYRIALNLLLILLLGFFVVELWNADEEGMEIAIELIMILFAVSGFCRIMSVIFSRLRLDLLRDIVRNTYAAEIIAGLLLLMVCFAWVMMYLDPNIDSLGNGLWYCFAIVTTIGFGDIAAASLVGRIMSVILGIYGIIVVALITSIIVNFYGEMKKTPPEDPDDDPGQDPESENKADA